LKKYHLIQVLMGSLGLAVHRWLEIGMTKARKMDRGKAFKPCFPGLNGALQHDSRPLWRSTTPHLYIEPADGGFPTRLRVHRPLKKSAFSAIFAFDLPGPRTYNPRPRCFAADVAKRCLPLNLDAKNVGGRCLTL
jgi:hypothetical protein